MLSARIASEQAASEGRLRYISGEGKSFHRVMVQKLRRQYGLKPRYARLRAAGWLTLAETAEILSVSRDTVKRWYHHGLLQGRAFNDKNECLYEPPGEDPPVRIPGRKLSKRRRDTEVAVNHTKEVQCEG